MMKAMIVKIPEENVPLSIIREVVSILQKGGVIGYPTETVYGLGGDAYNSKTVSRINRIKGRKEAKPFLVLVPGKEDVFPMVAHIPDYADILMNHFWPGGLTLVFQASDTLQGFITGGTGKVGIRVSSDQFCCQLMEGFQHPLVSTSANLKGELPARQVDEVVNYFGDELDMILDGGARLMGMPSTVVDVSESEPKFIRIGAIKENEIWSVIGGENG